MKVQTKKTLLETRKQKRKEKRSEKRQSQFLSWVQHKKNKQNQNASSDLPPPRKQAVEKMIEKRITIPNTFVSEPETVQKEKKKIPKKIPKKTKFQEFLEMEAHKDMDDLEIERNLAKKLKVKGGKLGGFDDGMNELFDGIPSVLNTNDSDDETALLEINEKNINLGSSRKKRKRKQCTAAELADDEFSIDASNREIKTPVEVTKNCIVTNEMTPDPKSAVTVSKYVAPHLRACTQNESQELSSIRRRIRGLLNRLSESNVESITGEVASIFRAIARRDACQIMCDEVLSSCSDGPRGNEQYAAVFAAFVAGLACLVGSDFSAKLIASLAVVYKNEYDKEDNLSLRNLTLLLCQLYIFGVCSSDLIYDFLSVLSKQMTELDVSTILAVLQCCGIKLRTDDPAAMKDLILSVQSRVAQMKLPSTEGGIPKINNKRMEFMLETICDIKNNKKRQKDDPPNHMRMKKWLQKLKAEDILLRGLKWDKLLDPNKKGQWWLSRDDVPVQETLKEVATTIDKEVLEAQKWMQLAAAQRMNTDVRRAIFCVIMSAEDYLDAFEKILRLDLSGKQDREIMRVLVECCLQEKVFNKYYTVLASKLCTHEKNHKFSLQYCLWDHFKELESMEPIRSLNLAKFVAEMICSFTLSLAVLKAVDLTDLKQMTAKKIMHFRIIFENIFEKTDAQVWNIFSRVATIPDHEVLSQSLEFFIKKFVIKGDSQDSSAVKFKLAKKGLNNVAGVLM